MPRPHRIVWLVLIAALATTVSAGAKPATRAARARLVLPKNLLTIYTDYSNKGVTQYVDATTNRVVATLVSRPKRGVAAAGSQGSAPSVGQRCSNTGTYNYFDAGVWRPWRMSAQYHINPSGAPSGMVSDWRNQLIQAKYVWEQSRNMCSMGAVIIWRMPVGEDTYVTPATDCGEPDGINLVGFTNFGGWDSDGIILARTCNWSGDYIYESDLAFNNHPDAKWANGAYPGYWDLQSVAAHEFGHSLGLGHVQNEADYTTALAVMHPIVYRGDTRNRTLSRGDVEGAWHLYPAQYSFKILAARVNNPAGIGVDLEPGRTYTATVDVQNTGYQPWTVGNPYGITVATAPSGRCSAFAGGDWASCSTASRLDEDISDVADMPGNTNGIVAQGEVGRFTFNVPVDWSREGTDNREWFRISQLPIAEQTVPIDVNVGTYVVTPVRTSGPGFFGVVVRGVPGGASLEVRNDGTAPWILGDGRIRLVTDPAGRCSAYSGSGWEGCTTASVLKGSDIVMPGSTATLTFSIYTPFHTNLPQGEHHSETFDIEVLGRPNQPRLGAKSTFEFTIY